MLPRLFFETCSALLFSRVRVFSLPPWIWTSKILAYIQYGLSVVVLVFEFKHIVMSFNLFIAISSIYFPNTTTLTLVDHYSFNSAGWNDIFYLGYHAPVSAVCDLVGSPLHLVPAATSSVYSRPHWGVDLRLLGQSNHSACQPTRRPVRVCPPYVDFDQDSAPFSATVSIASVC